MRLQLSNFRTECDPRIVEVRGNPLLTYTELRAGDGVLNSRGGDGTTIAEYHDHVDFWIWLEDGTEWTDIEVLSLDGLRTQVSV